MIVFTNCVLLIIIKKNMFFWVEILWRVITECSSDVVGIYLGKYVASLFT